MSPRPLAAARSLVSMCAVVVALAGSVALASQAGAASLGVKLACASDYSAHCGNHPVGSAGLRKCMRSHGSQLSSGCVTALVAAGEVSKAEVDRRRAAKAKTVARN